MSFEVGRLACLGDSLVKYVIIKLKYYIRKKVRKYKEGVYIRNLVARLTGT